MSENNRRVPTLIFNILFALACAAAIVMYFLAPIWRLDLKTQIPNETVQEMMGERAEGLDMDEVLGKENVTISLDLSLDSFDLALAVVQWNAGPMVEKMVELPCKIGDEVYEVHGKCDGKNCPYNGYYGQWRCSYGGKTNCNPFITVNKFCYSDIPRVGKTIFVTKEAAEARLAELKGGEG